MPTSDEASAGAVDAQALTAEMLREQGKHCALLGSAMYGELLAAAADDCDTGGPVWAALAPVATDDWRSALALRFMAAVHRLALEGRAPRLAERYPSVGGDASGVGLVEAFLETVRQHADAITLLAAQGCQTNEVGRCRALLPGFLTVARETGLGLRLLEIGSSGGLILRWDHYFVADPGGALAWGSSDSPVQLVGEFEVDPQLLDVRPEVEERSGCDPNPVDPLTDDGRLRLLSSLWADQVDRFARLRGAIEVAARVPAVVDQAPAGEWVPERVASTFPGVATVLFHSVVWQYLSDEDQSVVTAAMEDAGARATDDAPLAWLSMEPDRPGRVRTFEVRLRLWPGGEDRLIATAGAHGFPVRLPR